MNSDTNQVNPRTYPPSRSYIQSILHRAHDRRFLYDHEYRYLLNSPEFRGAFVATADDDNLVQRRQELSTVLRFLILLSQQNGWTWPDRKERERQQSRMKLANRRSLRQQQTVHN